MQLPSCLASYRLLLLHASYTGDSLAEQLLSGSIAVTTVCAFVWAQSALIYCLFVHLRCRPDYIVNALSQLLKGCCRPCHRLRPAGNVTTDHNGSNNIISTARAAAATASVGASERTLRYCMRLVNRKSPSHGRDTNVMTITTRLHHHNHHRLTLLTLHHRNQ